MIFDHTAGTLSDLDREVVHHVPPGGNWRDLPDDFPSRRIEQIRRSAAAGLGSRSTYYGRLQWDRPSYTVSTFFSRPGNGCFIHPVADRLITIREGARLQSFPDSHRFAGPMRSRFVQVGNAVPPLLAYQLAGMLGGGTVVDLFSGCGGLSLGFELAGYEAIAAADSDAHANATYLLNRPNADEPLALNLGDEHEHRVAIKEIKRRAGEAGVDVLAGGPPCQGFSTAGNCDPLDPRNRLVFAFVAAAAELKPRAVLMENVAALLFRRGIAILERVVSDLESLGYGISVAVVHTEGYGVPQLRRRCILVGTRDHTSWPDPWCDLLPPGHFRLQPQSGHRERQQPLSVRDAIADLPVQASANPDVSVPYGSPAITPYQKWSRGDLEIAALLPPPVWVSASSMSFAQLTSLLRGRR